MDKPFAIGDLVYLKGYPETPMVVREQYELDKNEYEGFECVWIRQDGTTEDSVFPAVCLERIEPRIEQAASLADHPIYRSMEDAVHRLQGDVAELERRLKEQMEERHKAIQWAKAWAPNVDINLPVSYAVREMCVQAETLRREANIQLETLRKRLKDAGLE